MPDTHPSGGWPKTLLSEGLTAPHENVSHKKTYVAHFQDYLPTILALCKSFQFVSKCTMQKLSKDFPNPVLFPLDYTRPDFYPIPPYDL